MPEHVPETIELLQNSMSAIDAQFQLWLTITFAAVVASFLARDQLSRVLRLTLATLYLLSVGLLALRMAYHFEVGQYLATALLRDISDAGPPGTYVRVIGWLRSLVMILGTLSATLFILYSSLARGPTQPPKEVAAIPGDEAETSAHVS